jgi:protein-L-isoaspartate(D-aspartate) O-methyltransferase
MVATLPPDPDAALRAEWLAFLATAMGRSSAGREVPSPSDAAAASGRPRTAERNAERSRLVGVLAGRGIRDPRVLQAVRDVPRHWFVPTWLQDDAYLDDALPIGQRQAISQPYIVALMTEALELQPDSRVLEIGTGSGYQAAVLSEITSNVWTIEIVPDLAASAQETFEQHGYRTIRCRTGDGWAGWPEEGSFDAVIVTAAPDHVPKRLFEQLRVGGRMSIPIGPDPSSQRLLLVRKREDGAMESEPLAPVRFVPMTGGEAIQR